MRKYGAWGSRQKKDEPQRLKPGYFAGLTARLKSCPDKSFRTYRSGFLEIFRVGLVVDRGVFAGGWRPVLRRLELDRKRRSLSGLRCRLGQLLSCSRIGPGLTLFDRGGRDDPGWRFPSAWNGWNRNRRSGFGWRLGLWQLLGRVDFFGRASGFRGLLCRREHP